MEARFNFTDAEFGRTFFRKFGAAAQALTDSALPPTVQELVKIRASQINGCGACTDMHTKDALAAGETQARLNLIAVWRDAKVFTETERVALALTEQGTRLADSAGVDDETWEAARKHFDDEGWRRSSRSSPSSTRSTGSTSSSALRPVTTSPACSVNLAIPRQWR